MTMTLSFKHDMEKYLTISKRKRSVDRVDDDNNQQLDTTDRNVDKTNLTDADVEDTVSKKNMKYDKTKRARNYLPQWETTWPWWYFDEAVSLMYCKYCKIS